MLACTLYCTNGEMYVCVCPQYKWRYVFVYMSPQWGPPCGCMRLYVCCPCVLLCWYVGALTLCVGFVPSVLYECKILVHDHVSLLSEFGGHVHRTSYLHQLGFDTGPSLGATTRLVFQLFRPAFVFVHQSKHERTGVPPGAARGCRTYPGMSWICCCSG